MLWDSSDTKNTFSLRWLKLPLNDSGYLPLEDYQIKISGVNGEMVWFNAPLEKSVFPRDTNMNYKGMYWYHRVCCTTAISSSAKLLQNKFHLKEKNLT